MIQPEDVCSFLSEPTFHHKSTHKAYENRALHRHKLCHQHSLKHCLPIHAQHPKYIVDPFAHTQETTNGQTNSNYYRQKNTLPTFETDHPDTYTQMQFTHSYIGLLIKSRLKTDTSWCKHIHKLRANKEVQTVRSRMIASY